MCIGVCATGCTRVTDPAVRRPGTLFIGGFRTVRAARFASSFSHGPIARTAAAWSASKRPIAGLSLVNDRARRARELTLRLDSCDPRDFRSTAAPRMKLDKSQRPLRAAVKTEVHVIDSPQEREDGLQLRRTLLRLDDAGDALASLSHHLIVKSRDERLRVVPPDNAARGRA